MDRAARKLHSDRGASMLLALVFLLICVTVGSSVLMAAASNGGRARSDRQEQQIYLALSSALELVADDLRGAVYTGKVTYTAATDDGVTVYSFRPAGGEMTGSLQTLFRPLLDSAFKTYFHNKYPAWFTDATDTKKYDFGQFNSYGTAPAPVTLTITPEQTGPLAGCEAEIQASVDGDMRISLTARLTSVPEGKADGLENFTLTTSFTVAEPPTFAPPADGSVSGELASAVTWDAGRILRQTGPEVGP